MIAHSSKDDLNRMVCILLRWGVLASLALMLIGFGVSWSRGVSEPSSFYHSLLNGNRVEEIHPNSMRELFHQIREFQKKDRSLSHVLANSDRAASRGIVALGIFLLILLPSLRVGLTALYFLKTKDWLYAALTLWVLGSLVGGYWGTQRAKALLAAFAFAHDKSQ